MKLGWCLAIALLEISRPVFTALMQFTDVESILSAEEQRPPLGGTNYPDSSVDLTCATVDSQKVKFPGSAQACFGTEMRMGIKNAEILVTNPNLMLGMESPGAAEYSPSQEAVRRQHPKYSFADNVQERVQTAKPVTRLTLPATGTPRRGG
eukprot:s2046_g2.t1